MGMVMREEVDYAALMHGDVVVDHDTFFVVTGMKSFKRGGREVWLITSVAFSEPHRVFAGMVNKPGDEYQFQGSGYSARALRVSEQTHESAGGDLVYRRSTRHEDDGQMFDTEYRIGRDHVASLWTGFGGTLVHAFDLGKVKDADMPGLARFSSHLGKLLRF